MVTSNNEQTVSKGYYLSKKLCFLIIIAIALSFLALILGLVLGLKNSCESKNNELNEPQKLEACKELTCRNSSYLQVLNNNVCPAPSQTTNKPSVQINYRLPTDLLPYYYDVLVKFQFSNEVNNVFPYDGEVKIDFNCVKDTSSLTLHINKIDIDDLSLSVKSINDQSFNEIKAFKWTFDSQRHFFVANFNQKFKAGYNYTFYTKFVGYLSDDNAGFYRSSYVDSNQVRKWLMTSQLESTDARKSFPSFDEPAMKAVFKIRTEHQNDYTALSNMPVDKVIDIGNNRVRTEFLPTPLMSSYLVALVVSDFVCIDGKANAGLDNNLLIRSCGRPNAVNQLDFGLDVGIRIIEYFEQLYGVKFPLPKCDHIAIPDFAAGAMENWGLVTYRQTQYLFNPGVTTQSTEQAIAGTIVHEIAHMWFGDIVSPLWWNDIWLNEGFAAYMQYQGTAVVKPKYQMIEQFKNLFFNLLQTDSSITRSISFDVSTPNEISNMFDTITYSKGASIIDMLVHFLGKQTFYKGINRYLTKYSYGNTDGRALWTILDQAAKEDSKLNGLVLDDIMNTWMKQSGHPVITIQTIDDRTISLTQKRFLLDPSAQVTVISPYNYRYYVPFTHSIEKIGSVNSNTISLNTDNIWQKVTWFYPNDTNKIIQFDRSLGDDEFLLANLRAGGFYRVNYDNKNWNKIIKQLLTNRNAIPLENRAQFIHDSIAFSEARIIDGEKPFEIFQYLSSETEELPWLALINRIGYFYNMLVSTSVYGYYQTFMSNLIRQFYIKLDWDDKEVDTWIHRQMRSNVVSFACLRGTKECIDKAKLFYSNWMAQEDNNKIPSGYRSFIYCTAIREGGEKEYNFAMNRYNKETNANERNNLLNGMSCSTQTWLISKFLNDLLDKNTVREQDALSGLRSAAIRPDAILKTWSFVKENWNELYSRYGTNLAGLLTDFSSTFNTQSLLNDFNSFFKTNQNQNGLSSQIQTAINRINRNIEWYKKNFNNIESWFRNQMNQNKQKLVILDKNEDKKLNEIEDFKYDKCIDCQY